MPKGKTTPENTWQRIEYWVKRNPDKTLEECQRMLSEKLLASKEAKPSNIEYWVKRNPDKTLEECRELLKKYKRENNFQCIEYWMKKHPEKSQEECEQLLKEAKKSYLKKRPDNSGENNPMHRSKVSKEDRIKRSPMTIEFWKNKYPEKSQEECEQLLKQHKEKVKKTHTPENTNTCVEYWMAKGYSKEEAEEIIRERQKTFTLEKCIKKYGVQEGTERYNKRQSQWKSSLIKNFLTHGDGRSAQSEFAYNVIGLICETLKILRPIKEKWMYDPNRKRGYAYDFTYNKRIIELNGDYWHANPNKYDSSFFNKSKMMSAEEIWLYDKLKTEFAESKGYKVLTIWESDWNNDPDKELKKCIEFLNG